MELCVQIVSNVSSCVIGMYQRGGLQILCWLCPHQSVPTSHWCRVGWQGDHVFEGIVSAFHRDPFFVVIINA